MSGELLLSLQGRVAPQPDLRPSASPETAIAGQLCLLLSRLWASGWRFRTEGLPQMFGPHCENGRRQLQPHDLCSVWVRVLLAVHEGDIRPALSLPVRMHFLGKEALVKEEEAVMAAGHACWGPSWHCSHCGHFCASLVNWGACVGWKKDSWQISELGASPEEFGNHIRGDCKYSCHPCLGGSCCVHRGSHTPCLCLRSCSNFTMQIWWLWSAHK